MARTTEALQLGRLKALLRRFDIESIVRPKLSVRDAQVDAMMKLKKHQVGI